MTKKRMALVIVVAAALLGGAALWRRQHQPGTDAANAPAAAASAARGGAQTVSTLPVQQRDVPVQVEAAGTVVSLNTVDIRPQVSSTVRTVHIKEGQMVRKGDLLFTFDDRADRANLEKARAQVLRDRATLADLERQWKRAQELVAQHFIAQSAADTVLAQLEAQQALTRSDEAAAQAAEVAVSFGSIRSPLDGRAGAISVYPGSLVQPASTTPLVTLSQIDPIGVSFTVPEGQLAALLQPPRPVATASSGAAPAAAREPLKLDVVLPVSDRGRGSPAPEPLHGQVSFVDNAVDTTTGTIRLKGTLPNAQQQLWPGQYVSVRLVLRSLPGALVVPQAALIQRGAERTVYVVAADGTAELRPVRLRYPFGEWAVVDGVKAGERVVVDGKQNLRPGTPVREAPASPGRGASGASSSAAGAASAASDAASGPAR